MTLEQLIAQVRKALDDKIKAQRARQAELNALRARVDSDTPPTDDEVRAAVEARDAVDAEIDALSARVTELKAEHDRDIALNGLQSQPGTGPDGAPATGRGVPYDRVGRVGAEERTYALHKDRAYDTRSEKLVSSRKPGADFLRDVARAARGNVAAAQRLERHAEEERIDREADGTAYMLQRQVEDRAAGTSAFAGVVVPQYLTEYYAGMPSNGRPFADICAKHDLPEVGMVANIGKVTTATSVATQANEGDGASETNIDDTLMSLPVRTAAGQQTLSRQASDRGIGTEDITMGDLYKRWAANIDSQLINVATDGLTNVATAVTYTDATPTAAELWPKLLNAQADAFAALADMSTGNLVTLMHSRRWFWLQSQVGTSWPFIGQPGIATQNGGTNYAELYGRGFAGVLPNGSPVVLDNNVATNLGAGTNEDEVYALDPGECHLFEDPNAPLFIRADQTKAATLQLLLVLFSYYAFTHVRVPHVRKVSGTGLVTPTF